jgi:hypothetical protein
MHSSSDRLPVNATEPAVTGPESLKKSETRNKTRDFHPCRDKAQECNLSVGQQTWYRIDLRDGR